MKTFFAVFALLSIGFCSLSAQPADEAAQKELIAKANSVIEHFEKGEYSSISEMLTGKIKEMLTPEILGQTWEKALPQQLGKYKEHGEAVYRVEHDLDMVNMRCTFEKSRATMKVQFDGDKKITGLMFMPMP